MSPTFFAQRPRSQVTLTFRSKGRFKHSNFFIPNVRISGSVNTESIWSLQTCVMWTSVRFSRMFLYLLFAAYDPI